MRRALWIGLVSMLVAGLVAAAPGGKGKDEGKQAAQAPARNEATTWQAAQLPEGQAKAVIPVEGMKCGKCCVSVEQAVKKLDGIVSVKADYEKGIAKVIYEKDKVKLEEIVKTINENTSFKASMPKEQAKRVG